MKLSCSELAFWLHICQKAQGGGGLHLLNRVMFNLLLCGVLITKLNLFVLKSLFEPIDILKQYPLIYIVSTEAERESGVAIVHGRHVTLIPIKSYKC